MSDAGAVLFARYAYPPNRLGYCGPAGAGDLLRADAPDEIGRWARQFEGAWPYLEFLAAVAGHADPLDEAVVRAYWIGGDLLARADPAELVSFLRRPFAGQLGGTWREAGGRALAHHSFHVFEVYPWAELLRRTGNPAAATVLDRCRIRTGTVAEVRGETAVVSSRPLVSAADGRLVWGPPRDETVAWSAGGRSLLAGLLPGDRVALHWDWVCDVLTEPQADRIDCYEQVRLALR